MPIDQAYLQTLGLKTGDLVLFSCETLFSTLIKTTTNSKWSHLGTIVIADDGTVLCFETALTLTLSQGVQINPLDNTLNENVAFSALKEFAIRRLIRPLTAEQIIIFRQFIADQLGKPYEYNLIDLVKPAAFGPSTREEMLKSLLPEDAHHILAQDEFGTLLWTAYTIMLAKPISREDQHAKFCSELVTESLQRLGLLDTTLQAATFAPGDYSETERREEELKTNAIFGTTEYLQLPNTAEAAITIGFNVAKAAAAILTGTDSKSSRNDEFPPSKATSTCCSML